MRGDQERRVVSGEAEVRALRHEVHNALYAVELTTAAMVGSDASQDREALSRVVSEEVARIRAVLPTLAGGASSVGGDILRQARRDGS